MSLLHPLIELAKTEVDSFDRTFGGVPFLCLMVLPKLVNLLNG